MHPYIRLTGIIVLMSIFQSCSKKIQPSRTTEETINRPIENAPLPSNTDSLAAVKNAEAVAEKKKVVKPRPKTTTPKLITVNDQYAKKSVDGRLYYDLEGKRYWKNYKDGKYYLFNKSMLTDENFKAPK